MHKKQLRLRTLALVGAMLMALQMGLGAIPTSQAAGSEGISFANGAFRKVWEGPDYPVASAKTTRGYTWGPEGWAFQQEDYVESPGGKRLVQYFDKTRMEITNPRANTADPYYVTNGLLVTEMVSGRVQLGNSKFQDAAPSEVPVAGDAVNNPGPTYRSFKSVSSLNLDNKANRQSGEVIKATISRDGKVATSEDVVKYNVKNLEFNPELSHNIPDVFWNFMIQQGQIYPNGAFTNGLVINWVAAMGFPITEPYWTRTVVGGQEKDVLIQLFQRRVLTYTPTNADAFKVEMGNVGAHYYAWRYPGQERQHPWANLEIQNHTSCGTLSIIFSGQDSFVADVPQGVSKAYKLGPGVYHYKATVSDCNATPLENDVTYDPNSKDVLPVIIS